MSTGSSSKVRSRDGWYNAKEMAHLRLVTSGESDVKSTKMKLLDSTIIFNSMSSKTAGTEDIRQDENSKQRNRHERELQEKLGTIEMRGRSSIDGSQEEMGFEVEMNDSLISSKDGGGTNSSGSTLGGLAFSFSKISDSGHVNTKSYSSPRTPLGHLPDPQDRGLSRPESYDLNVSKSGEANDHSVMKNSSRKRLFIDVGKTHQVHSEAREVRDDTPKAHNRSTPPTAEEGSKSTSRLMLLGRRKQGVEDTRSTIVQHIEPTHDESEEAEEQEVKMALGELRDNAVRTTKPQHQAAQHNNKTTEISHRSPSPSTHSSLEDPEDIDAKWERLSEKILNGGSKGKNDYLSSASSCESDGVDAPRWDQLREKLLSVTSSPRSNMSEGFAEELIRDCVETGLPSPSSEKSFRSRPPTPPRRGSMKQEDQKNSVDEHPTIDSIEIDQPPKRKLDRYTPKDKLDRSITPTMTRSGSNEKCTQTGTEKAKLSNKQNLEYQNKCFQETTIETVASGLTGEYDDRGEQTSWNDGETNDDSRIRANFSSCSESQKLVQTDTGPLLKGVLSSASESCPSSPDEEQQTIQLAGTEYSCCTAPLTLSDRTELRLPEISLNVLEENIRIPRIEVTLDSSSSQQSKNNSHSSSTSVSDLKNEATIEIRAPQEELKGSASSSQQSKSESEELKCSTSSTQQSKSESSSSSTSGLILKNEATNKIQAPQRELKELADAALFTDCTDTDTMASTIASEDKTAHVDAESVGYKTKSTERSEPFDCKNSYKEKRPADESAKSNTKSEENLEAVLTVSRGGEKLFPIYKRGEPWETALAGAKRHAGHSQEQKSDILKDKPATPRVIITGREEAMFDFDSEQNRKSSHDECEAEVAIIDTSSTLTGSLSHHRRAPLKEQVKSTPVLRKSSKPVNKDDESDQSTHLSVGCKNARSFDTRLTASTVGVPSWRLEPSESLADFTIQILNQGNGEIDTYHVHKHVLAVGPRRSEFLDKVFCSNTLSSAHIALEEKAANLFPLLLDFVYCHDVEVHVTTETAVAYRKVATTFKVIPLLVKVAGFILEDLKSSNMSTYVTESTRYKDQKVMKLIIAKCAEQIEKIDVTDPLWTVMEPDLFLRVIANPAIDREKLSTHLSILVTEYQTLHKYEMDKNMFGMLTSEEVLPVIDRSAALPLLEICDEYGCPKELEHLQKRCAYVMACYWKVTSEADRRRLFSLFRSLPSSFTVDFLESVETGKSATLVNALAASKSHCGETNQISDYGTVASFSLGSLCDDLAGEDGYSVESADDSPLSWRADPEVSYSDWKIKIKHQKYGKADIYNVHKHILSIGQYRSSFFSDLFLSEEQAITRRGATTIELAPSAAALVPTMLDFIYSPEHHLENISKDSAVALRFLARVFGVWMLNKKVLKFVHKDMRLSNMLTYLDHSKTFDDDKIASIAVLLCAKQIQSIDVESPLLHAFKPEFFGKIVSSSEIDKSASCHVSILIAKYFTLHDLDEALLAQLLKESQMPEIDCMSAMKLLEIIASLKSKDIEFFKELRNRCAQVLTENWFDLREEHREDMFAAFRNLEADNVADIFDTVESEYHLQNYHTMTLQCKLVKRYRSQLADAKKQREEEVANVWKEMEEKVAEMLAIQQELEKKLKIHGDHSTSRALRSSGAYRSHIPTTRKSGTPIPRKVGIPNPSKIQSSLQLAVEEKTSEQKKSQLPRNSARMSRLLQPKASPPKPAPAPKPESSLFFGFSLFACTDTPPASVPAESLPATNADQRHLAKS